MNEAMQKETCRAEGLTREMLEMTDLLRAIPDDALKADWDVRLGAAMIGHLAARVYTACALINDEFTNPENGEEAGAVDFSYTVSAFGEAMVAFHKEVIRLSPERWPHGASGWYTCVTGSTTGECTHAGEMVYITNLKRGAFCECGSLMQDAGDLAGSRGDAEGYFEEEARRQGIER